MTQFALGTPALDARTRAALATEVARAFESPAFRPLLPRLTPALLPRFATLTLPLAKGEGEGGSRWVTALSGACPASYWLRNPGAEPDREQAGELSQPGQGAVNEGKRHRLRKELG